MEKLTILGATGFVGQTLVKKALEEGYFVKVLVRDKSKLGISDSNIEIIEGDYFDKDKISKALAGSDAVLSTVGPPMKGKITSKDVIDYLTSFEHLISQMLENNQKRFVNISGAGIKLKMEKLPIERKLMRIILKIAAPKVVSIKDGELNLLEKSDLDWTSIRPPMITKIDSGQFIANENLFLGTKVDVNQLVDFMITEIEREKWNKKAVVVATI